MTHPCLENAKNLPCNRICSFWVWVTSVRVWLSLWECVCEWVSVCIYTYCVYVGWVVFFFSHRGTEDDDEALCLNSVLLLLISTCFNMVLSHSHFSPSLRRFWFFFFQTGHAQAARCDTGPLSKFESPRPLYGLPPGLPLPLCVLKQIEKKSWNPIPRSMDYLQVSLSLCVCIICWYTHIHTHTHASCGSRPCLQVLRSVHVCICTDLCVCMYRPLGDIFWKFEFTLCGKISECSS